MYSHGIPITSIRSPRFKENAEFQKVIEEQRQTQSLLKEAAASPQSKGGFSRVEDVMLKKVTLGWLIHVCL